MGLGVGHVGRRVVGVNVVVLLMEVHSRWVGIGRVGEEVWLGWGRESKGLAGGHVAPGDEGVVLSRGCVLSVPPLTHKFI